MSSLCIAVFTNVVSPAGNNRLCSRHLRRYLVPFADRLDQRKLGRPFEGERLTFAEVADGGVGVRLKTAR
jgi:hypothetical protein